ncbi:MAG: RHS repeat domain-containing protein, partial [Gammaproteobacteria bacterium]
SYGYDPASRLTGIVHNGPAGLIESLSYVYDAAGNRISLTRTNGTASNLPAAVQAAYDVANEQIKFGQSLPPTPNQTFDANGNLTSDGTNTYTWDARNRLITISGPGLSASFTYDALGRRSSKTINGVATDYLYDGNDIAAEIQGGIITAMYLRSLNIDEPFVRQTAMGNEFYHTDALGSTLDLTNQAGSVQVSYQYEAFGKTIMTGTSTNPFQYTGRENDGTGLYYYRSRYYGPLLQRFTSEDMYLQPFSTKACPRTGVAIVADMLRSALASNPQNVNLYAYTGNSATNFSDPLGLKPGFGYGKPLVFCPAPDPGCRFVNIRPTEGDRILCQYNSVTGKIECFSYKICIKVDCAYECTCSKSSEGCTELRFKEGACTTGEYYTF